MKIGVRGSRFTLNGELRFLLGISYYGALGASEDFIIRDLYEMRRYGFNWLRVWATWSAFGRDVSAVDEKGDPHRPYLNLLRWIVEEADRIGMVVDVTLSRRNSVVGPPRLRSTEALCRAAETIVKALEGLENWYLDIANERNIKDRFVRGAEENQ